MTRSLHVACLQTRPQPTFPDALAEAGRLVHEAADAGAQWLLLPEYCGGLRSTEGLLSPPIASEDTHPFVLGIRRLAQERRVWLSIGSAAVSPDAHSVHSAQSTPPTDDSRYVNRSFLIDPAGDIVARYDKVHLFDVSLSDDEKYVESAVVSAGSTAVLVNTPFAKVGLSICYDLRFPQLYRTLAQAGAEILCTPAAFTQVTGEAHWHVLNRARAIENGAFVIAPCAIGPIDGGGGSYGHSLIIDPWGKVLADGGTKPGVVDCVIDLDAMAKTRQRIPSLDHDRPFTLTKVEAESSGDEKTGSPGF